jgi:hypothetical protein
MDISPDKSTGDRITKIIAVCQSNYIPWKGYFDLIRSSDEFVIYDIAQYTKNDWRNRNRIRTSRGSDWLTIPVQTSGRFGQPIHDVLVKDHHWARAHWKTIQQNYRRAKYFPEYKMIFEDLYSQAEKLEHLSDINLLFLHGINQLLEIRTPIRLAQTLDLPAGQSERLVSICLQLEGTYYLSGPKGQSYLNVDLFRRNGIQVGWMDYDNYPEYVQLFQGFDHHVSIIDLIFNAGPNSFQYMRKQRF